MAERLGVEQHRREVRRNGDHDGAVYDEGWNAALDAVEDALSQAEAERERLLDTVRRKWVDDLAIEYPAGDGTTLDPAVDAALHYAVACLDDVILATTRAEAIR